MGAKILIILALYATFSMLGEVFINISQSIYEQNVIAACLVLEAGGEGEKGMQAVMNVIQNRAAGSSRSYYSQTTKPKQFSCFGRASGFSSGGYTSFVAKARRSPSWETSQKIVRKAFAGKLPDLTSGATHYYAHTRMAAPAWSWDFDQTVVIGSHTFLKKASLSRKAIAGIFTPR